MSGQMALGRYTIIYEITNQNHFKHTHPSLPVIEVYCGGVSSRAGARQHNAFKYHN
jgi:hypothetical protein